MRKRIQPLLAIAGLVLLSTNLHAEEKCAVIEWKKTSTEIWNKLSLSYVDCETGKETQADYKKIDYGTVKNALVGSKIELGPWMTSTNYTKNETVRPGTNNFTCTGKVGTTGKCIRK